VRPGAGAHAPGRASRGSAVVDFVLVGSLVVLMFVALLQLALALHVRNILADSATAGARHGALQGTSYDDGVARAEELIDAALGAAYSRQVTGSVVDAAGYPVFEVRVRATVPLVWLLGPQLMEVRGRAVVEEGL